MVASAITNLSGTNEGENNDLATIRFSIGLCFAAAGRFEGIGTPASVIRMVRYVPMASGRGAWPRKTVTGFELRALRDSMGISRSEAARLLQISETALRRFEGRTGPIPHGIAADSQLKFKRKESP
jgi:hypothetical protein